MEISQNFVAFSEYMKFTEPSKRGDFNILVARKKGYAQPDRQLKSQIKLSVMSHFQKNKRNHCSLTFPPAVKSFYIDSDFGFWGEDWTKSKILSEI